MGDRVEERDIRGETFLNRSDSPMRGLIVFPFISPTRFRIFGVKREARSVRGRHWRDRGGPRLRRIEGIRLPMAVVYFFRLKVEVTLGLTTRPEIELALTSGVLPYHHRLINSYSELING